MSKKTNKPDPIPKGSRVQNEVVFRVDCRSGHVEMFDVAELLDMVRESRSAIRSIKRVVTKLNSRIDDLDTRVRDKNDISGDLRIANSNIDKIFNDRKNLTDWAENNFRAIKKLVDKHEKTICNDGQIADIDERLSDIEDFFRTGPGNEA